MKNTEIKQNKKDWCLYVHISPSNKAYIGVTQNHKHRWNKEGKGYLHKTKNGKYNQPAFANAILKYGWDNFQHHIIKDGLTKEEAFHYEILFIKMYNTVGKNGYNLSYGGEAIFLDRHHTQETKDLISKILKEHEVNKGEKNHWYGKPSWNTGKKMSKEFCDKVSKSLKDKYIKEGLSDAQIKANEAQRRKVNQYDMDGNLIKTWDGLKVASKTLGIQHTNISAVCLRKKASSGGRILSAGGFQWRYADDCDDITPYKRKEKDYSKNMYKKVARIDDDGNILKTFNSIVECANYYGINPCGISANCKGRYKSTHGYKFKYI